MITTGLFRFWGRYICCILHSIIDMINSICQILFKNYCCGPWKFPITWHLQKISNSLKNVFTNLSTREFSLGKLSAIRVINNVKVWHLISGTAVDISDANLWYLCTIPNSNWSVWWSRNGTSPQPNVRISNITYMTLEVWNTISRKCLYVIVYLN